MGPVEYMIMTFPTTSLDSRVGPSVQDLVDTGLISVLDMLFVTKDIDGTVTALEADQDSGLESLTVIDGEVGALISGADIDYVGDGLLPGQSALVLVCEDRWARALGDVLRDSGGVLYEGARIPTDVVEEAWTDIEVVA
ncbi:MAG TPA: DUF6325 family protein [Acidimicrobiales bacterium]|nr:DUF6325 family protein [Acidimicrobiales bacterium]